MAQQDRWWLAISIVWLFLTMGVLLYLGFAWKGRPSWDRPFAEPRDGRPCARAPSRCDAGRSRRPHGELRV